MKTLILIFLLCGTSLAKEQRIQKNGTIFITYEASPKEVGLYWKNPAGKTFRQFSALQSYLHTQNKKVRFIMNGGLFEEDGSPCGLLVIDGKALKPLNLRDGVGNFYLKPSGVFFIDDKGAHIVSSEEYAAKNPQPSIAIQSGPLLLRNGVVHPAFRKDSKNALHRNGVGVKSDGSVLFVMTEFSQPKRVTLHEFAEFFRSQGCANALFLDGDISQMRIDPKGDITPGNYFGTIFCITEETK